MNNVLPNIYFNNVRLLYLIQNDIVPFDTAWHQLTSKEALSGQAALVTTGSKYAFSQLLFQLIIQIFIKSTQWLQAFLVYNRHPAMLFYEVCLRLGIE